MNIGIMSSWAEKCGISEYSKDLVEGLQTRDIKVKVVGNYPLSKLEPDQSNVNRFFDVPFLTNKTDCDLVGICNYLSDCEIVHIQFETSLYHPSWFPILISLLKSRKHKVILTMHSSGMWAGFPGHLVDFFISHREDGVANRVIPMGVKFYEDNTEPDYKSIISFGLGRNQDDWVNEAIKDVPGSTFHTTYGHHKWLPKKDLIKEIQKSWVISLLYPPVGATSVSSSASMLAMGCQRPLLVTDTMWFKHVIEYPSVFVCDGIHSLKDKLIYLMYEKNRNFVKSVINETKNKIIYDGRTYENFIENHLKLYSELS